MGPTPAVATVRRAVRAALPDVPTGATVLVACSGGADSTALAAALAHESRARGWRAGGVSVDHGVQSGSAARARSVAAMLRRLGLHPVEVVSVLVDRTGGPEAAARRARYGALDAAARRHHATAVLLGHTLDDQAETVLLGLARGSGARSLAGMAAALGTYTRPFLALPRSVTTAACSDLGLPVWDDPHNADLAYARVRVRTDALPALERTLGPGIAEALARTASQLRDDADALDEWADAAQAAVTKESGAYDVAALGALPRAVRTRLLRRLALAAGCPATDLSAVHVGALDRLVTHWRGQAWVDLPGGRRGVRRDGALTIQPPTATD